MMTFLKEIPCTVSLTEFYTHIFLYTDLLMVIINSIYGYRSLGPGVIVNFGSLSVKTFITF